jgi:hypothetical protein
MKRPFRRSGELPRWRVAASSVALAALIVGRSPANAATPTLVISPVQAAPGQTVTASGTEWDEGLGDVRVFAGGSDLLKPAAALATVPPQSGAFATPLTVPELSAGGYRFVACQRCGDVDGYPSASFEFTILATTPTATTSTTVTAPRPIVTAPTASTGGALPVLAVVIVLVALASWLVLRQRPTAKRRRPGWQPHAEDAERQGPGDRGSWYCHRGTPSVDLRGRRITALPVRLLGPGTGGAREIMVGADVLVVLNRCLDYQRTGADKAVVHDAAAAAAWGTWAAVERALSSVSGRCDAVLWVDVHGSQAACPFTLYQCRRARDSSSHWTQRAAWTGTLTDEKRYALGVLRSVRGAPAVGDAVTAALTDRFVEVVRTVSVDSLLDRVRFDSEWELDLGGLGRITW